MEAKTLNTLNHLSSNGDSMTNMTLAMPDEISKRMKKHPEIRWTSVARQSIERKLDELEFVEKIAQKSKLTMKDVEEISAKIKHAAAKKLGLM